MKKYLLMIAAITFVMIFDAQCTNFIKNLSETTARYICFHPTSPVTFVNIDNKNFFTITNPGKQISKTNFGNFINLKKTKLILQMYDYYHSFLNDKKNNIRALGLNITTNKSQIFTNPLYYPVIFNGIVSSEQLKDITKKINYYTEKYTNDDFEINYQIRHGIEDCGDTPTITDTSFHNPLLYKK